MSSFSDPANSANEYLRRKMELEGQPKNGVDRYFDEKRHQEQQYKKHLQNISGQGTNSGALELSASPNIFNSPVASTIAGGIVGAAIAARSGRLNAFFNSAKFTQFKAGVGEAFNIIGDSFRAAQIDSMVAVGGSNPVLQKGLSRKLGHHSDLEIFETLDDVIKTRERLVRMTPEGQGQGFMGQVDAELRELLNKNLATETRGGFGSMTVNDVLDMAPEKAKELFGEKGLGLLQKGLDDGIISGGMSLGKGVLKGADGQVMRTDLVNVASGLKGIKSGLNQFQLPIINMAIGDLITSPIQHVLGRENSMRLVRGIKDPTKASLLIGKKLFDIDMSGRTAAGLQDPSLKFVSDNMRFGVGAIGSGVLGRRGQLPAQQRLAAVRAQERAEQAGLDEPGLLLTATELASDILGFGKSFQTDPFIGTRVRDAFARRLDGTLVHDDVVRLADTGIQGRMSQALADTVGVNPVTGSPVTPGTLNTTIVDNPNIAGMGLFGKLQAALGVRVKGSKYVDEFGEEMTDDYFRRKRGAPELMAKMPTAPTVPALPGENVIADGLPSGKTTIDAFAYEDNALSKGRDLLHFGVNRLNELFGHTFGLGVLPQSNTFFALFQAMSAHQAVVTGFSALEYTDYLVGRTVGALPGVDDETFKPSNIVLGAYSAARGFLQDVREATGISDMARGAEDAAPGVVSSTLSNAFRLAAGPALGLIAKSKAGVAAGVASSILLGDDFTGSIMDTPEDIRAILSGEKEVAIRKARYWEFGKQDFSGGKIDYYTQGFVARRMSNYKMTSTLYGSETEYYSNETFLPTPTNLFGLRKLISGSKLQERHLFNRPYPGYVGQMEDALTQDMMDAAFYDEDAKLDYSLNMIRGKSGLGSSARTEHALTQSKIPGLPDRYRMIRKDVLANESVIMGTTEAAISDTIEKFTEQFGIYKFLGETGANILFGNEEVTRRLANSDFMASKERAFYDEQLGGLGTLSELPRRFMPSSFIRSQRSAYNPLPNLMPTFLPGQRSEFEEDKDHYLNFHTGDPYGKIKHGEMRLPGEAYERMHRLHSGTPGVYDAMDRYLMLSDVAPGSESHKHYEAIVQGWSKSGALDEYWEAKFQDAKQQEEARMQVHNFRPTSREAIKRGEEEGKSYNLAQQATGFLWDGLSRSIIPRIGAAVPLIGGTLENKLLATRDAQETYLKQEIYDTDEYDWAKPYETMIRPMFENLTAKDPITATIGGGIMGYMFAANPASKALFALAGGAAAGLFSSGRAISTGSIQNGYIPDHVKDRREVDEYCDRIEYMKYKRLEQAARRMGNFEQAEKFRDQTTRTVSGLNYHLSLEQFQFAAMKALPTRERAYFQEFLKADEGERESILRYLPEYVKPVYEAAYAKMGDQRYQESLQRMTSRTADQRVAEYLTSSGRSAPNQEWAGWNPNIKMDAIRYETAMAMGNSVAADIHRSGLTFARMDPVVMGQVDTYDLDITDHFEGAQGLNPAQMFSLESELRSAGLIGASVDNSIGLGQQGVSYDFTADDRNAISEAYQGL